MSERWAFRLLEVGHTELRLHPVWAGVIPFLSWSLAVAYFPSVYPVFRPLVDWALGVAGAFLLLAMVLLHELTQLGVLQACKQAPHRRVMLLFGSAPCPSWRPCGGALSGLAGIAASLVLALLTFWAALNAGPFSRPLEGLLGYLALVNALLGLVHLFPGLPLDGGRLLYWGLTKLGLRNRQAYSTASLVGAAGGFGSVGLGAWLLAQRTVLPGCWMILIGAILVLADQAQVRVLWPSTNNKRRPGLTLGA